MQRFSSEKKEVCGLRHKSSFYVENILQIQCETMCTHKNVEHTQKCGECDVKQERKEEEGNVNAFVFRRNYEHGLGCILK